MAIIYSSFQKQLLISVPSVNEKYPTAVPTAGTPKRIAFAVALPIAVTGVLGGLISAILDLGHGCE